MVRQSGYVLLAVVCLASSACQGDRHEPKRYAVSGKVTLGGQPLPDGLVYFKTVETGAMDCLDVKDGEFRGQAEAGERRIEVYRFRTSTQVFDGMKSETKENLVPTRYNLESRLTAKVTPAGPNEFVFELTSP